MEDLDSAGRESLVRTIRGTCLGHVPQPVQHRGKIDAGRLDVNSEFTYFANLMHQPGRLHQALAGHARAQPAFFRGSALVDQGNPGADTRGQRGQVQTPGASTDHHKVIHCGCLEIRVGIDQVARQPGESWDDAVARA